MVEFDTDFYYDRIESLIFDEEGNFHFDENRKEIVFLSLFDILKEIIDKISAGNKFLSSTFYSKLSFVLNASDIPKNLFESYFQYRILSQRLFQKKQLHISENDIRLAVFLTVHFINSITDKNPPDKIDAIISGMDFQLTFFGYEKGKIEEHPFLRLVVKDKIEYRTDTAVENSELICYSDIYGECTLLLYGIWAKIYNYASEGSVINLIEPYMTEGKITATKKSIVVFEPDILVDTTELTYCFMHNGDAHELYFMNLFADTSFGKSLIIGNLVNFIFDEMLQTDEYDYEELFIKGISQKPLTLMTFDNFSEVIDDINLTLKFHFENIELNKKELNGDSHSIEPSFMSPLFGLQGRLDLMTEHKENLNRKDIIELKSGRAPSPNLAYTADDIRIPTGIWVNHHVQTLCYNMLLDSAYDERTGTSRIYYSSTQEYPLRNAPDNPHLRARIMDIRNRIVSSLTDISNGKYSVLNSINKELIKKVPPFLEEKIKSFLFVVKSMSSQERNYFKLFVSFISREILTSQIGNDSGALSFGASSLWLLSKSQKKQAYLLVTDLVPDIPESDFHNRHIIFTRKSHDELSVFRKGDICLLYPEIYEGESILKSQLIKCVIQEIDENKITVSLRNKITDYSVFFKNDKWCLEQDYNLINSKKLFNSLFQLFTIPKEKRDIILGNMPSGVSPVQINLNDYELSTQQREIYENAIKAKDYYLIQGPPGTGKTSYMLKNLVKYYYENTDDDILLVAYTNRAVDEICNIIKAAGYDALRTGSRQSSEHRDIMISYLSGDYEIKELYKIIKSRRVVISTVSSLIQNPEIFRIKKFKYAIVDEASQILEPQIAGIISSVDKFILIGDEKQLPAIVVQPDKMKVKNTELLGIMLDNPGNSYFERMIRLNIAKGFTHSYGMLEYQARMHSDIMQFSGRYFYSGKLKIFDGKKLNDKSNIFENSSKWQLLSKSRVGFINTAAEKQSKVNRKEAAMISELVSEIIALYGGNIDNKTIGIISPFRAQCAEIKKRLPGEFKKLIDVETVERFQGSERDVIIYSFAVNYEELLQNITNTTEIDNVLVDRKLNVAMTRAKEYLIMFGSRKILSKNSIFDLLMHNIENRGNLINFWEILKDSGVE